MITVDEKVLDELIHNIPRIIAALQEIEKEVLDVRQSILNSVESGERGLVGQMDVKQTLEVLEALQKVGELGAKVLADGKISISDIKYLGEIGEVVTALKVGIEGIELVDDEIKDISLIEAKEIVTKVIDIVKAIKDAKNV